jgi:hypothetical protein
MMHEVLRSSDDVMIFGRISGWSIRRSISSLGAEEFHNSSTGHSTLFTTVLATPSL